MKNYLSLIILLLSQLVLSQNLQTNLQTIFNNNQLMGMSVYVLAGENESVYNFGYKNFNQSLLVDNTTKYRIASISKSFSALGLMKLYDQNLFQLDDDISTYLGYSVTNPNHPTVPITFRMLLSHTSSLQDGTGYTNFLNATYSQNPIPNISSVLIPSGNYYTANIWRNETPGTYFAYSNLNFGLIGTLIEKISQQRFDLFMKNEILIPLGISGSFNIQDITTINDVATIYRKVSGIWSPQFDVYNGITPTPPNLTNYVMGTNGAYFAPQGGLRASVTDVSKFLKFIKTNGLSVPNLISPTTIETMKTVQWTDNGTNGNDYYGLFNKWSLGLHHANTNTADYICNQNTFENFVGHTGEAYGLISDAFYSEINDVGFVFITNGSFTGYTTNTTSFYTVEDQVFNVLCSYFNQNLNAVNFEKDSITLFPNPTNEDIEINFTEIPTKIELHDVLGKLLLTKSYISSKQIILKLDAYNAGIYFLRIYDSKSNFSIKKIVKF
jgi:CubicO group peptidase (beta-lactamase class C family)